MIGRIEKTSILVAGLMLVGSVLSVFPTPSWWMEIDRLNIHDSAGGPIIIDYDRAIKRDFTGKWRVEVWREQRGEWSSWCAAEGTPQEYRPEAVLPRPVTLEWLAYTQPRCYTLPAGTYRVELSIDINPGGFWARDVSAQSNAFLVSDV